MEDFLPDGSSKLPNKLGTTELVPSADSRVPYSDPG
jgi:hypothetical protein